MIERITSVDVYSHLRLEVAVRSGARERNRASERSPSAGGESAAATLDIENRDRRRLPAPEAEREADIVRYEQSATADDSDFGRSGNAEEVLPSLAMSTLPRDWRLAQAAQVYNRAGRSSYGPRNGNIGTRLNAVA